MSANTRTSVIDNLIAGDAQLLSKQLQRLREKIFPPESKKALRRFSSGETAKLIGVSDSYLRQLSLNKQGPVPDTSPSGRRQYTLEQVNAVRRYIGSVAQPDKQRQFLPHRASNDHLQVIAVTNFKGGSGKTTTSVHLAQYLTLRGYRVLAIDLDPQASLSSLLGFQPEFDLKANETLYGAVRYDDERRPLSEIIRKTYFDGLSVVPANLELHEFEHTTPRILAEGKGVGKDLFFARIERALSSVEQDFDVVVIDCPPQLGFLTLSALCASTSVLVTVHPQMLDVASMSQFLLMTSDLLSVVREAGGDLSFDFFRYVITRHETNDGPQAQIIGFLRSLFGDRVLTNVALKSTAISDAGLSKQTIYEVDREGFSRSTYQRAIESLDAVNGEIESLIRKAWRRE
jgi:chromosome partitioning protein